MKTVLVAGVSGFVGKHLVAALHQQHHQVFGCGIEAEPDKAIAGLLANYTSCDLTDPASVAKIPLHQVDAVVNLAGLAKVGASFKDSKKYLDINVAVHTVLLDELQKKDLGKIRVVAISTGAVYSTNQPMPLLESSSLISNGSPYALSKIAMEKELESYRAKGLDVIVARPFNHIGPGQLAGFLLPDLVSQVLHKKSIVAGDLSTRRDYTDVRDVVRAYVELATREMLSDKIFNVCSGKSVSGQELLDLIFEVSETKEKPIEINNELLRPNDPQEIFGSFSALNVACGWQPTISLRQTVEDYLASL